MLFNRDRVKQQTATTGTSNLVITGTIPAKFQGFSIVPNAREVNYTVLSGGNDNWEDGLGTWNSSTNTLSRDIVFDGSSGPGVKVSLAGTSTVLISFPADYPGSYPIVKPPLLSNWTQRAFGASTVAADVADGLLLSDVIGTVGQIRALTLAVPATPYTVDFKFDFLMTQGAFGHLGVCFTDGTKYETCALQQTSGLSKVSGIFQYSNSTSFVTSSTTNQNWEWSSPFYMRIGDNGTNVSYRISSDGETYQLRYSVAKASGYLGSSGYSNYGFYINVAAATNQGGTAQTNWIRVRSRRVY